MTISINHLRRTWVFICVCAYACVCGGVCTPCVCVCVWLGVCMHVVCVCVCRGMYVCGGYTVCVCVV